MNLQWHTLASPDGVALLAFVIGAPIWCVACAIYDVVKRRRDLAQLSPEDRRKAIAYRKVWQAMHR